MARLATKALAAVLALVAATATAAAPRPRKAANESAAPNFIVFMADDRTSAAVT